MLVDREEVLNFIPQRDPIVVVHGLISHAEESSTSTFTVGEDHLFSREGKLLEAGLIENIAQTVALRTGYGHSLRVVSGPATRPPIGFIASVKKFTVHRLPTVGQVLETTVSMLHDVMEMLVVRGTVSVAGELMAECEMIVSPGEGTNDGKHG